ncbi:Ribosomal large subunit pseudouridine synthase D [Granulosicoccus antarcticus IMCC3135]|uniref:Pseudouridine synthase n=2 Tax=Granulosicoccus TaxID=437504 RepID=A0A2Z2P0M2_9GAMM|nr:Ribosomal large subunit pseudouridine synthase D [Granulosicoccus antarcticus IMCC3135]
MIFRAHINLRRLPITGQNDNPAAADVADEPLTYRIDPEWAGKRLDAVAAILFDTYSRNRLQSWIAEGYLTVNGEVRRSKDKIVGGETISLQLPPDLLADMLTEADGDGESSFVPQAMDLNIVHADEHILIINKPAGLVMHPAPGNRRGTLLNGLLHYSAAQAGVPRAGIVHRLDKDTSGLCVVARTLEAHTHLVRQLQAREMGRIYTAVVVGEVPINGTIDAPIGRHARDRKRMAVTDSGKPAVTHFECVERYLGCARVMVKLETGRTHQIRVHMTHIGHALIGDPAYGRRLAVLPRRIAEVPAVADFKRQALHATRLSLIHPGTEEPISFEADMPEDMEHLCDALKITAADAVREAEGKSRG